MRKQLHPDQMRKYQWKMVEFVKDHSQAALFVDMGLGKTVSCLTVIKALLVSREVPTWLAVGPLRVVQGVWRQEAAKWSHTQDVVFSLVHGSEKKRRVALEVPAHVYLINPEGLVWLVEMLHRLKLDKPGLWPFLGLLVDESSMFKSSSTKRWAALAKVLHLFKRRVILTGTPTPNNLMEIWPQLYLLDMGERLGSVFWRFKSRFFEPQEYIRVAGRATGTAYAPRPGAERTINRAIKDIVMRLDAADWLQLPDVLHIDVRVDMPADVVERYEQFEEEMFMELETADVEAVSAAVLSMKCHQIANGALYGEHRDTGAKTWEPLHDAKLSALDEIVNECGGPLLVAYQFKHDLERLRAAYPRAAVVADYKNIDTFSQEWNDGKHAMAFVHPKSAGHGNNWQYGGRNIAFFSLTWSREQIDQIIARIGPTRQAQAGRTEPVKVYRVITNDTVDEAIVDSNEAKQHGQRALLNALNDYRDRKANR